MERRKRLSPRSRVLVQYLVREVVRELNQYQGTLLHPTLLQSILVDKIDKAQAKLAALDEAERSKKVA
jgi:hypothetical protein